jgi:hypothetical protein
VNRVCCWLVAWAKAEEPTTSCGMLRLLLRIRFYFFVWGEEIKWIKCLRLRLYFFFLILKFIIKWIIIIFIFFFLFLLFLFIPSKNVFLYLLLILFRLHILLLHLLLLMLSFFRFLLLGFLIICNNTFFSFALDTLVLFLTPLYLQSIVTKLNWLQTMETF